VDVARHPDAMGLRAEGREPALNDLREIGADKDNLPSSRAAAKEGAIVRAVKSSSMQPSSHGALMAGAACTVWRPLGEQPNLKEQKSRCTVPSEGDGVPQNRSARADDPYR
jgi:hypothetical protein